jgi:uncharacterized membrane protein
MTKIVLLLGILLFFWSRIGFEQLYLDTDLGRDLYELSNIAEGKTVWLGPRLSAGLHASPIYYYLLYPGLVLSGGDARSLMVSTLALGIVAIGTFAYFAYSKWNTPGLLAAAIFGLLPWWKSIVVHPGNGYTYAIWLFLGLTGLWFGVPIFFSALGIGLAVAYHPAALFALPILFYEWWKRGHSLIQGLFAVIGLALPWAPIIVFEVITKGYMTRSWLSDPSASVSWSGAFSLDLIRQAVSFSGVPTLILLIGFCVVACMSKTKMRWWMGLTLLGMSFFTLVQPLPYHYLLGITTLFWFSCIVALVQQKWGSLVIGVAVVIVGFSALTTPPLAIAERSIPKMERVIEHLYKSYPLDRTKKIAVVAALTKNVEVPQADDYRFFLRMDGYTVLDPTEYAQADILIEFIEVPGFDWQHWSTWEIEQFGEKKLMYQTRQENIDIIVFEKRR